MDEQNTVKEVVEEIKSATEEELRSTIEKWYEQTRTAGMRIGATYIAAAVIGTMDKHLKKGAKPSLRDYERCFKDVYKIVSVQLNTKQNDSENENDGTAEEIFE